MNFTNLKSISGIEDNNKLQKKIAQFQNLLSELEEKLLDKEIISTINNEIEQLNRDVSNPRTYAKQLKKFQAKILKDLEKTHKMVIKNYYRNTWMAIGMVVFGLPLGVAFGASIGNNAFLGIGMPVGMVIGMAVGTKMDEKASAEGRQLNSIES
jgi:uncharacterized protein YcfJ